MIRMCVGSAGQAREHDCRTRVPPGVQLHLSEYLTSGAPLKEDATLYGLYRSIAWT